jgi:hypothetical protein
MQIRKMAMRHNPSRWRRFTRRLFNPGNKPPSVSSVTPADWDRTMHLTGERDAPTQDIIEAEDPTWLPPPDARRDPWRPRTTLGK